MLSNNTSLIPLLSAPEGNLNFKDSGSTPPLKKSLIIIMETPHASSASPKHMCQVVDKVTVFLHGSKSKRSLLSPNNSCSLCQSQGRENTLLQAVPLC